jgi:hypothetical protein
VDGEEPGDVCGRGGQRADDGAADRQHGAPTGFGFNLQITLWLWFTVLFANFAEAMAEGRGKAQADTLRKAKGETIAQRYKATASWKKWRAAAARGRREGPRRCRTHTSPATAR